MGHNQRHTDRLLVHTTAVFHSLDWWKLWQLYLVSIMMHMLDIIVQQNNEQSLKSLWCSKAELSLNSIFQRNTNGLEYKYTSRRILLDTYTIWPYLDLDRNVQLLQQPHIQLQKNWLQALKMWGIISSYKLYSHPDLFGNLLIKTVMQSDKMQKECWGILERNWK
jgi:hypothetical protein